MHLDAPLPGRSIAVAQQMDHSSAGVEGVRDLRRCSDSCLHISSVEEKLGCPDHYQGTVAPIQFLLKWLEVLGHRIVFGILHTIFF
jgi:hypothetical protein